MVVCLTRTRALFSFRRRGDRRNRADDHRNAAQHIAIMANRKSSPMTPLRGRVALVAGATRGAGRGIARALAEAGATVYCTGRSVTGKPSPYRRPETIDETAAVITAARGEGTPLPVGSNNEAGGSAPVPR